MSRSVAVRAAALLGLALTVTAAAALPAPATAAPLGCDPVAPAGCLLPFPNDYFTVPDPDSATGLRVHFDAAAMPANLLGQRIDPTEWNRQDGFSPGEPILVQVPGLDPAASHLAAVTDVGASLADDAPVVLRNSQGGIDGGALAAIAQDYTRAVLGVPGMNYSTLVQRSVDFAPFQQVMNVTYPDPLNQQVILALLQMLWDRGEADGYAQHLTADPLPGTPPHTVLLHVAFGDHQVSNVAAEVEARTIGARLHQPALAPGWSDEVQPYWGIPALPDGPYTGPAMVVWNSGAAFNPPPTNLPPDGSQYGADPHEYPRNQPAARQQKATFLLTGVVDDVCRGAPCPPAALH